MTGKNQLRPSSPSEDRELEKNLRSFAVQEPAAVFSELLTTSQGLTQEEAKVRLEKTGKNVLTSVSEHTLYKRFREAVVNPFNMMLIIIAVITLVMDAAISSAPDYVTVGMILFLIAVSSTIAFVQSARSDAAAKELSAMISNKVDVIRGGIEVEILMEELVPGDIVKLAAGDMIPADIRFLSTKDTFIAQAALTGESAPAEKFAEVRKEAQSLTDLESIGFMGSNVVSGSATAVVLYTGNGTYVGSMARALSADPPKNSFERGVDSVSGLLIRLTLIMVPVIFIVNGLTKGDWIAALLFAVTIAIGLTPEMLPVIMTSTLAKGAVAMSRRNVIVKTLGTIQTFGEMDILCTDKTGTLTQDKIVLEKYINIFGEDDQAVLKESYLNSHYQTGLKNLMDLAIISRAEKEGLTHLIEADKRIDEIPFDFERRRMSVVLEEEDGSRHLITKGAVEEMLAICTGVQVGEEYKELTQELRNKALATYENFNAQGLRMIAVAQKLEVPGIEVFSVNDESSMTLIGFVGFLDPPKESAQEAIRSLQEHGVRTVVLTGDSEGVAIHVCSQLGMDVSTHLSGKDVEGMEEEELKGAIITCNLFSKLSPAQKERVVQAFQDSGHTVGYMGDGINDAPSLRRADVGISVDSAVDIAKETADIILLKKDLLVLKEGVLEGRRTFGNIVKYIKMAASGNFGNMFSVLIASIFLPFLPMLPLQILTQNLLTDISQMGIPFDKADLEYMKKPRKWETKTIKRFMAILGPVSSVFDILCFLILWFIIGANSVAQEPLFHAGWFVLGSLSQVLIIHTIRTSKIPFFQSMASKALIFSTSLVAIVVVLIGFTPLGELLQMRSLPMTYIPWLLLLLTAYTLTTQGIKWLYMKKYGEWL